MKEMRIQQGEFKSVLTGNTIVAFYRTGTNDRLVLQSCIEQDEYKVAKILSGGPRDVAAQIKQLNSDTENLTCIDLGAHIGAFTLLMLDAGFKVTAVEPIPVNMELLQKNVQANGWDENCRCIFGAAGPGEGKKIHLVWGMPEGPARDQALERHRFIGGPGDLNSGREYGSDFKTYNIKELLRGVAKCQILKTDCEGGEVSALDPTEENMRAVKKISAITGEIHVPRDEFPFLPAAATLFDDVTEELGLDPTHYVLLKRKEKPCSEAKTTSKSRSKKSKMSNESAAQQGQEKRSSLQ